MPNLTMRSAPTAQRSKAQASRQRYRTRAFFRGVRSLGGPPGLTCAMRNATPLAMATAKITISEFPAVATLVRSRIPYIPDPYTGQVETASIKSLQRQLPLQRTSKYGVLAICDRPREQDCDDACSSLSFPFPEDFLENDACIDDTSSDGTGNDQTNPLDAVFNIAHALQVHRNSVKIAEIAECLDGVVTRADVLDAIYHWQVLRVFVRTDPQSIRLTAETCNLEPD